MAIDLETLRTLAEDITSHTIKVTGILDVARQSCGEHNQPMANALWAAEELLEDANELLGNLLAGLLEAAHADVTA